jgi:hypothetical protein
MRGRIQIAVAIGMAYLVMLILISPTMASPMGTLTSKHTIQPPHVVAPLAALALTAAVLWPGALHQMVQARPVHPIATGSEIVDFTVARLC